MNKINRSLLWLMFLCVLPTLAWTQTLPVDDPTITKPGLLIIEDYKGPDGSGDQGGYVLVTFKHTTQHAQLARYRIWRELLVPVGVDITTGKITTLAEPERRWVPWAVVEAKPASQGQPPLTWAVVPTLDGVATRWAITAEMGNQTPGQTSEENDKESLALLGIQSAMPQTELEKIIGPSYKFAQALLGGRKDRLIGELDLDPLRRVAMRLVDTPFNEPQASDATLAATAVRAIDNIPPATVDIKATIEGREVTLTWNASRDDRDVGLIPYRGWAVQIPGVHSYDVYRGADETRLERIAMLPFGTTTFKDMVDPELGNNLIYRITVTDLDNATPSAFITVVLGDNKSLGVAVIELEKKTPAAPTDFALHQNYPNPANPATIIKYDLAEGGRVELRVYNLQGQIVRTLVNSPQAAGRYYVAWDGRDSDGRPVSSGVYFYRLTTEKFKDVKKLTLLK